MFDLPRPVRGNTYAYAAGTTAMTRSIELTPFHPTAAVLLFVGLAFGLYHGLAQIGFVARLSWVSWSHIHFVTIGGLTQLIVGTLPQLTAQALDRPGPSRRYTWGNFLVLNGSFLLLWWGRGWGVLWAFDAGLVAIWGLVAALAGVLFLMLLRSEGRPDPAVWLYVLSPFVFLWGITFAYGLFAHHWSVPGGWLGLREAHVHANAWGFLGFAVIGTLYRAFPRVAGTDRRSGRFERWSVALFALGIFPLMLGPWLGMGRTVTATGLVLYAIGFGFYLYSLTRTYLDGSRSALARWLLVAQAWIIGPAGFAPFVLFGVEWVNPAFIEDAALHFFFIGWALPVALAGLLLSFVNVPVSGRIFDPAGVPGVITRWMGWAWNLAVLVVGVGFLYQDQVWSAYAFGIGWTVIAVLWAYLLLQTARLRGVDGLRTSVTSGGS